VISIRRYGKRILSTEDLLKNETFTTGMLDFMSGCVEARLKYRDFGRFRLGQDHHVEHPLAFHSRGGAHRHHRRHRRAAIAAGPRGAPGNTPPNIEGAGAITQRDLVINTLRMRPDRIIVGESRGPEALDMLQAMNTGHDGSMTTVHANSPRDAFSRLETMVMMASQHVPDKVIRQQLASAINIVVHTARMATAPAKPPASPKWWAWKTTWWRCRTSSNSSAAASARAARCWAVSTPPARPICLDRLKTYGIHLSASIFEEEHLVKRSKCSSWPRS